MVMFSTLFRPVTLHKYSEVRVTSDFPYIPYITPFLQCLMNKRNDSLGLHK